MNKPKIDNQFSIHEAIANRWSPRSFSDQPVSKEELMPLFEAARWAASCFNEQPWRFLVGLKGDETYDKIFNTIGEFNQQWVKSAPVVVLVYAKRTFSRNDKPNAHYWYDTGQAVANLATQATHNNLYLHQMAGFGKQRAELDVIQDNDYEAICTFALGYLGDGENLSHKLKETEYSKQSRKSLDEIVIFND